MPPQIEPKFIHRVRVHVPCGGFLWVHGVYPRRIWGIEPPRGGGVVALIECTIRISLLPQDPKHTILGAAPDLRIRSHLCAIAQPINQ